MNEIELELYKTRKSVLEVLRSFDIEYSHDLIKSLSQCNSCGIWLKPLNLLKDLDGLDICNDCYKTYGP